MTSRMFCFVSPCLQNCYKETTTDDHHALRMLVVCCKPILAMLLQRKRLIARAILAMLLHRKHLIARKHRECKSCCFCKLCSPNGFLDRPKSSFGEHGYCYKENTTDDHHDSQKIGRVFSRHFARS